LAPVGLKESITGRYEVIKKQYSRPKTYLLIY
jgi:hypothetical protein